MARRDGTVAGTRFYFYVSGRAGEQGSTTSGVCTTGLAVLRRDGFASMDAGQTVGTLTTRQSGLAENICSSTRTSPTAHCGPKRSMPTASPSRPSPGTIALRSARTAQANTSARTAPSSRSAGREQTTCPPCPENRSDSGFIFKTGNSTPSGSVGTPRGPVAVTSRRADPASRVRPTRSAWADREPKVPKRKTKTNSVWTSTHGNASRRYRANGLRLGRQTRQSGPVGAKLSRYEGLQNWEYGFLGKSPLARYLAAISVTVLVPLFNSTQMLVGVTWVGPKKQDDFRGHLQSRRS